MRNPRRATNLLLCGKCHRVLKCTYKNGWSFDFNTAHNGSMYTSPPHIICQKHTEEYGTLNFDIRYEQFRCKLKAIPILLK